MKFDIFHRNKSFGRQNSLEDINLDQFLKISNYEETIKQLDIYYGIVKRQLLQNQSDITGLFPMLSTDREVESKEKSFVIFILIHKQCYL
jgi:phosphorylase kinase alpha/beta subunit